MTTLPPAPTDCFTGYTLSTAIKSCMQKYCTFRGRATRSEYWMFQLAMFLINLVAVFLFVFLAEITGIESIESLSDYVSLAFCLPNISVFVRRMHDIGKSGWNYWWGLLPVIGWILLLIWLCRDTTPGANEYGPSEKYPEV